MVFSVKRGLTSRWLYLVKLVILLSLIYCTVLFLVRNESLLFQRVSQKSTEEFQYIKTANGIISTELHLQVEIYSRASLGEYLWTHLLEGKKELMPDGILKKGNKTVDGLSFTYQSGDSQAFPTSQNVVLVVDGSSIPNQKETESWLKRMLLFHSPRTLFLVILGNKNCSNQWIVPYLVSNGGPINAVFITGDSLFTNRKEIFPWILGVATHLDFPLFFADEIDILSERPFVCNFLGIVRPNSSREVIPKLFKELGLEKKCFLKTSKTPMSNIDSIGEYIQTVSDSDVTLCPASELGDPETHCIYEALSLGSVPVVEEKAGCGGDPLDLLRQHKAPIALVKSIGYGLSGVIALEEKMNLPEKIARRATITNWYADFRHRMAKEFVSVLRSHIEDK